MKRMYLIQSVDPLMAKAIQNAVIIADNKKDAVKMFSTELRKNENSYCEQKYRPEWFDCQRINLQQSSVWLQYGGSTGRFSKVREIEE